MNPTIANQIIKAVNEAKKKHPLFAEGNLPAAICLATEELGETAQAINDGKLLQARSEALDTIAVMVRMVEMIDEVL